MDDAKLFYDAVLDQYDRTHKESSGVPLKKRKEDTTKENKE
jgi:hypothetical protein